jgi:CBS domain-containing protein
VAAKPPAAPFLDRSRPLMEALEILQQTGLDGLAVVESSELIGMLTRRSAAEAVRAKAQADADRGARAPGAVE